MNSKDVRSRFLEFFASKDHRIVESAPIVLRDDPTLMFTNAGMNQFKDSFLGLKVPVAPRVADTQRCMRVTGKHNDLDDVGHDTYHHTMFEMLGNWSFADYYKKEAIEWAWELIVDVYGIDESRIYATIFGGDEEMGLGADEEAREYWKQFLPDDRILEFDKKDNFWEMGETGPCGPCSEMHIDLRSEEDRKAVPGHDRVNQDDPEVIEIWNLVFMEFNKKEDKTLTSLPGKNVDTGMGFERLCMVLQGVRSSYDSDVFSPYREFLEGELGCKYGRSEEESIAMRVVMDHVRSIAFTIADGQLPSNNKAGYVIRRILRRASRYGFRFLGQAEPFLYRLIPIVAGQFKGVFDNVSEQQDFIMKIVEEEEKSFLRTLEKGSQMFDEYLRQHPDSSGIDGEFAFTMYDTYGFPVDLIEVMARENGRTVDMEGYERFMEEQKDRSRSATAVKAGDWIDLVDQAVPPVFTGYDSLAEHTRIQRYRRLGTAKGEVYQLVLEKTPFYAESGGQVGDTGTLRKEGGEVLKVLDTKKENEFIVHTVDRLPEDPEGEWVAEVDGIRRRRIIANHSATHLLHAALRQVLGDHVEQRGSLVHADGLRFDFSHFGKVTDEELKQITDIVNTRIAEALPGTIMADVPIDEAREMGAMALFGEKYGDNVRVVIFDTDYSVELCGGTHVANTAEIRLFEIVSESSSAAGIRRIEALTGDGALNYVNERLARFEALRDLLKQPRDEHKALSDLIEKQKELEKEIENLNAEKVGDLQKELRDKVKDMGDFGLLAEVVSVPGGGELKTLAFDLRKNLPNTLIVLGAEIGGKPLLNVTMSEELSASGRFHAGNLVRELAKHVQGGGGGAPHFASAGGKDASGLSKVMEAAEELAKA